MLQQLGKQSVRVFDCDREVRHLQESGKMARELTAAFGAESVDSEGKADRDYLRKIVFSDPDARKRLEEMIHPKLFKLCMARQEEARKCKGVQTFVIDVPLYFERGAMFSADKVCVVASSEQTQRARLEARNGFDAGMIQSIIDSQMPMQTKADLADVVFWNEGDIESLQEQVRVFFRHECAPADDEVQEPIELPVIDLNELRAKPLGELQDIARVLPKRQQSGMTRAELVYELGRHFLKEGHRVVVSGVIEQAKEHYAMIRDPKRSFRTSPDDVYIGGNLLQKFQLRPGHLVTVSLRKFRTNDKFLSTEDVLACEGKPIGEFEAGKDFDRLTPLFPKQRILLENKEIASDAMRVLDLVTPIGMGQRGLIVAPPRGGKTVLLKTMARSIRANYPKVHLLILLLDERPEEVTDFEENVDAPVFASTFDEPSRRHAQVSDLVIERAKRLVEQGEDVIIMLDSLTRLSRGYNANQSGGRIMSGGLGSNALEKPRKFFGAARNVEEGGSLTIIATCLVDTESRMDEVIFEEFKGTGNMEIRLDRELSDRRIYPAINISLSGTRNDDRLYHVDEMQMVLQLRRQLAMMPGWEGLESLLKNIRKTQNNAELLLRGLR